MWGDIGLQQLGFPGKTGHGWNLKAKILKVSFWTSKLHFFIPKPSIHNSVFCLDSMFGVLSSFQFVVFSFFLRPFFWLLGSNVEFREILVWSFRLRDDIMLADPNSYRFVWWEAPWFWPIYWAGEWWTENQRRGTAMALGWWEQDYSCMICSMIILALIRNYLLWSYYDNMNWFHTCDDCIGDHFKLHLIYKWTSGGVRRPNRQISPHLRKCPWSNRISSVAKQGYSQVIYL